MNNICPAVWDHLCINTNGKNRLCCNSHTRSDDSFLNNFDEHWNAYRDRLKKEMLDGKRPKECNSCWDKEDLGVKSLRQYMIERHKNRGIWEDFKQNIKNNKKYPLELDLKLGNFCNLSCRMCSSYSSSKYQTEFKKIYQDTKIDYGIDLHEKDYKQNDWYNTQEFYNFLIEVIENGLTELKFTGGEPMIIPNVKKVIDYICKNNKANGIYLSIITNATKIDKEWIEKFLQFIHTNIIVSVDGTAETYEYIRYPAVWNNIHDNLKLISAHQQWKMQCTVTFTLQNYNILQSYNMIELSRNLNLNLNAIPLDTPSYLDVRNAPETLKEDALKIVDSIDPINEQEQSFLNIFRKKINQPPLDNVEELKKQLVDISTLKDPYKNQDFNTLEISKYYD